jgi:metallophosphoesterase (TIGR03767 family)
MDCLSSRRTIGRAEQSKQGTEGTYYRLAYGPGEVRRRRLDLVPPDPAPPRRGSHCESLLHFVHCTDIHLVDAESPGRFEFVERLHGPEPLGLILPAYRPQEFLNRHAFEALVWTINRIEGSPETGAPIQFMVCSGDSLDNAQHNELSWFLTLMAGGTLTPSSGGPAYEGVAAAGWNDPNYWHPDACSDFYKERRGFPTCPDLLHEVVRPFRAEGVRLPWLVCYGNHDALINGTALNTAAYEQIVTGSHKPWQAPAGFDPIEHLDLYIHHPEAFLSGPARSVTPDPARRAITIRDFVEAHRSAGGEPRGHGFTRENLARGTAYYVCDAYPPVRLVVLDTTTPGGHYQGSVGASQLRWLEERLVEVHSWHFDAEGRRIESGNEDRPVVVISHHGLRTLSNPLVPYEPDDPKRDDLPRYLGPEVATLLHRFPNVILWLSGHIHRNVIRPRPDPAGRTAGFWEVITSSLLDWPCQARLVEIVSNGDGTLSVLCTMVDHVAPLNPQDADGIARLASVHRELAANDPHGGIDAGRQGEVWDRTVELVIPAPFTFL